MMMDSLVCMDSVKQHTQILIVMAARMNVHYGVVSKVWWQMMTMMGMVSVIMLMFSH